MVIELGVDQSWKAPASLCCGVPTALWSVMCGSCCLAAVTHGECCPSGREDTIEQAQFQKLKKLWENMWRCVLLRLCVRMAESTVGVECTVFGRVVRGSRVFECVERGEQMHYPVSRATVGGPVFLWGGRGGVMSSSMALYLLCAPDRERRGYKIVETRAMCHVSVRWHRCGPGSRAGDGNMRSPLGSHPSPHAHLESPEEC